VFSNTEIASVTDSLAAFGARTLISAAIAAQVKPKDAMKHVTSRVNILSPE
jgi:hypothetical protein